MEQKVCLRGDGEQVLGPSPEIQNEKVVVPVKDYVRQFYES